MTKELQVLKSFVEGILTSKEFEQQLYKSNELAELLSTETIHYNWADIDVFLYVTEQNYNNAGGRLNALEVIKLFLEKKGIQINASQKYSEEYDLLLSTSPEYIDVDPDFFEKYILPNDPWLSKSEKKEFIKNKYAELFKYHSKPPKWIQNPHWLINNNKPLFFLGQLDIKNCKLFHDDGSIYIFLDAETGNIETVRQFY